MSLLHTPIYERGYNEEDDRQELKKLFDIELGYVCKPKGDKIFLPTKDAHRTGLGIKVRVLNNMKRLKVMRGLIVRGVTRIALADDFIYFDTDDLKPMALYLR